MVGTLNQTMVIKEVFSDLPITRRNLKWAKSHYNAPEYRCGLWQPKFKKPHILSRPQRRLRRPQLAHSCHPCPPFVYPLAPIGSTITPPCLYHGPKSRRLICIRILLIYGYYSGFLLFSGGISTSPEQYKTRFLAIRNTIRRCRVGQLTKDLKCDLTAYLLKDYKKLWRWRGGGNSSALLVLIHPLKKAIYQDIVSQFT